MVNLRRMVTDDTVPVEMRLELALDLLDDLTFRPTWRQRLAYWLRDLATSLDGHLT